LLDADKSQAELGRIIGVDQATISRLVSRVPVITRQTLRVLSLRRSLLASSKSSRALYTAPGLANAKAAGVPTYVAKVEQPAATVAKYLEIPIDVAPSTLHPVAARKSSPSGFETLSLSNARQQLLSCENSSGYSSNARMR
jgi:hypothetical protein